MQNNCTNQTSEYAGFWVRLSAYLIDMAILTVPLLILRLILWGVTSNFEGTFITKGILFQYTISDIILYLAQVAYFVGCTYVSGMTIGKKLLNLKVVYQEEDKKLEFMDVLFRETIGRFLNSAIFNVGYLFVGLDSEKRGFHDFLSDTRVIYTKKVKVYQANQSAYVAPISENVVPNKTDLDVVTDNENAGEIEIQEEESVIPQTFSFVPEQVTAVSEEELWHMPQKRPEEPKEENEVTYSWSQFEYVEDENKKVD